MSKIIYLSKHKFIKIFITINELKIINKFSDECQ